MVSSGMRPIVRPAFATAIWVACLAGGIHAAPPPSATPPASSSFATRNRFHDYLPSCIKQFCPKIQRLLRILCDQCSWMRDSQPLAILGKVGFSRSKQRREWVDYDARATPFFQRDYSVCQFKASSAEKDRSDNIY
jgi:hypothetical protein